MIALNPAEDQIRSQSVIRPDEVQLPHRYTLTHSNPAGDLFLTIGTDYDHHQISGLNNRMMRDEVLAEL